MNGTEKQVKWAEDIIETARQNIKNMADYTKKFGSGTNGNGFKYEAVDVAEVEKSLEAIISQTDDAAVIIEKRQMLSADTLKDFACRNYFKRTGRKF